MADDTVNIDIDGDSSGYQSAAKKAEKSTDSIGTSVTKLKVPWLAVGAAVAAVGVALKSAVQTAAKFEDIGVQFRVLTGDVDKAEASLQQLQEFSSGTPFQFEEVATAGKTFLAFGFEVDELTTLLQQTGDVAAATGQSLTEIALIYGQVGAAGKLTGERLLQLRERGINVGPAIAETMGTTEAAVTDLVSSGKVSFDIFAEAFKSLSDEGGIAFGGLELKSQTLNGKLSTLADNWDLLSKEIGDVFLPIAKDAVDVITELVRESAKLFKDDTQQEAAGKLVDRIIELQTSLQNLQAEQSTFDKLFGNEALRQESISRTIAKIAELNVELEKLAQDELERQQKGGDSTAKIKERTDAEKLYLLERGAFTDELRQQELIDIAATDEEKLLMMQTNIEIEKELKDLARADELAAKGNFLGAQEILDKNFNAKQLKSLKAKNAAEIKSRQTFFSTISSLATSENKTLAAIGQAAGLVQIAQKTPVAVANSIEFGTQTGGPVLGAVFGGLAYAAMAAQAAQLAGVKGFADGGVIGGVNGASVGSDDQFATVKTGEVVLNAEQQQRLLDIANGVSVDSEQETTGDTTDININFNAGAFMDALETEIVTARRENRTAI